MPGAEPPCGGAPNLKRVQHAAEAALDLLAPIAGDLEGLVHDVRPVVADRAGRQLDAVADDVVLERLDGQRILGLQRLQPALRHGERVVAEVDLSGVLVELEHREIDDPAERGSAFSSISPSSSPSLRAHRAGEFRRRVLLAADEEHGVAVLERRSPRASAAMRSGVEVLGDRALAAALGEDDVAEARARPARAPSRSACRRSCAGVSAAPGAGMARTTPPAATDLGEHAEAGAAEDLGDIGDDQRVAQVGLVGAVFQHRLVDRRCAGTAAG